MAIWQATWRCARPRSEWIRTFVAAMPRPASEATNSLCWPRAISPEQAACLGERIRHTVCDTPLTLPSGAQLNMSVSIGVAGITVARDETDLKGAAERLLADADAALYKAKQLGRNRVELAAGA